MILVGGFVEVKMKIKEERGKHRAQTRAKGVE